MKAQIIEVIRVVNDTGTGTPDDPVRTEVSYWTKDGTLLVRMDINDDPASPLRPS